MKKIQFFDVNPYEYKKDISQDLRILLEKFFKNYKPKQPNEYLTRKEVAAIFKVDISTIHNWCKSGKLKPLGIGNRVYFLRSDIDDSLTPINQ